MFLPHIRAMVIRARNARLPVAKIQALTGVPARSQRRIAPQEEFGKMSTAEFRERRPPGRPAELPTHCQAQCNFAEL